MGSMNISVLGGGSWGTALAVHLAGKGHSVKVWEFFTEQAAEMQQKRFCKLLPQVRLPDNIFISSDMGEVIPASELVIIAVPSGKVESTMKHAGALLSQQPVVLCSKGFADNMTFLSDVVSEHVSGEVFCLYGPTHAEEVCKGIFSGIVLAGGKGKEEIKKAFESRSFRVDLSDDIIGVQVASAMKNILAVFTGILDGAEMGDNTKAYILTKGLAEIKDAGLKLGGKENTFYGLAGLGDIIVTCGSKHSRNFYVGQEIGKGRKLTDVLSGMAMIAEGVATAKHIPLLKEKTALRLPLFTAVHEILFEEKNVKECLENLSI